MQSTIIIWNTFKFFVFHCDNQKNNIQITTVINQYLFTGIIRLWSWNVFKPV